MTEIEIILIVIGAILVLASFIFSGIFSQKDAQQIDREELNKVSEEIIRKEVEYELANIIDEKVEETEVKLDKITNEKLLELGNYSENILEEIKKNHTEVMFLYNMLNEKEDTLKDTIRDIEALKISIKQMAVVSDFAIQAAEKKKETISNSKKVVGARSSVTKTESSVEADDTETKTFEEVIDETKDNILEEREALLGSQEPLEEKKVDLSAKKPAKNNNQLILELYNKGKSNIEIAKELGLGIGEVRLVIDLFNNSRKSRK